jgi:hypothetical protein
MYSIDPKTGKRLYTLKKAAPDGKASTSAHPGKSTLDANFHRRQAHLDWHCFFLLLSPTCFVPHSSIFTGRQIFSPACCMQKTFWYSSHSTTTRSDVNTFCSSTLYKKKKDKKKNVDTDGEPLNKMIRTLLQIFYRNLPFPFSSSSSQSCKITIDT